jgi:N-acetylglucosamine-6-phosphate deacetylase
MATFHGRHYHTGEHVEVTSDGSIISDISEVDHAADFFIAPGLVDIQVNGYLGVEFTAADLTGDEISSATSAMYREGVTTYLPTIITTSKARLMRNFRILAEASEEPDLKETIPGFHLEGPYISPENGFRGAHSEEWVKPPDWDEFLEVYEASGEKITLVSLAPEIDGALEFIEQCTALGLVISLAHHNASAGRIREAIQAGARLVTHLGNGMANTIHRHENPLWAQLAYDELHISIIADGFHLTPEEILTFYKVKGDERTILVSDTTQLAGMPAGEYEWDGKQVVLEDPGVIKLPEQNVLAGAAAPLRRGVEHFMQVTGADRDTAFRLASQNPAQLIGLTDRGKIAPGKLADFILYTMQNGKIQIQKTVKAGKVVFER